MDIEELPEREAKKWISFCLRAISESAESGLEVEEATRRARRLKDLILSGRMSPGDIELDSHQKDVLCALVYRVLPEESEGARKAVAGFIRGIPWEDDLIGEKEELVRDSAAAPAPASGPAPDEKLVNGFGGLLPLVHSVLVDGHELAESEATDLERELSHWFSRFRARPGSTANKQASAVVDICRKVARERAGVDSAAETKLDELLRFALSEIERQRRPGYG